MQDEISEPNLQRSEASYGPSGRTSQHHAALHHLRSCEQLWQTRPPKNVRTCRACAWRPRAKSIVASSAKKLDRRRRKLHVIAVIPPAKSEVLLTRHGGFSATHIRNLPEIVGRLVCRTFRWFVREAQSPIEERANVNYSAGDLGPSAGWCAANVALQ